MKKLTLLMGIGAISYAANGSMNYPSNDSQSMNQEMMQTYQNTIPSDCSHLSESEKVFALQLSDMHRTMFCRHFSVSQRLRAMTLNSSEVKDLMGKNTMITPDEAVETVMKDARQDKSRNGIERQRQSQQRQERNPYSNYSYPNSDRS